MTSWQRGKENEEEGEALMDNPDLGDKVKGAGLKAAGEAEQGINNVQDKLTGKQEDWKGEERNTGAEAGEWVEHRGEDIQRASKQAADETK